MFLGIYQEGYAMITMPEPPLPPLESSGQEEYAA